jgi:hypothetical protein
MESWIAKVIRLAQERNIDELDNMGFFDIEYMHLKSDLQQSVEALTAAAAPETSGTAPSSPAAGEASEAKKSKYLAVLESVDTHLECMQVLEPMGHITSGEDIRRHIAAARKLIAAAKALAEKPAAPEPEKE